MCREGVDKSKVPCVYFHKKVGKWYSRLSVRGKKLHLGYFDDRADAVVAFNKAVCHFYGSLSKWWESRKDRLGGKERRLSALEKAWGDEGLVEGLGKLGVEHDEELDEVDKVSSDDVAVEGVLKLLEGEEKSHEKNQKRGLDGGFG